MSSGGRGKNEIGKRRRLLRPAVCACEREGSGGVCYWPKEGGGGGGGEPLLSSYPTEAEEGGEGKQVFVFLFFLKKRFANIITKEKSVVPCVAKDSVGNLCVSFSPFLSVREFLVIASGFPSPLRTDPPIQIWWQKKEKGGEEIEE